MELILTFPVILIVMAGIIEFALIFGNMQQVALASRVGAKIAAESATLNAGTATDIRTAADRQLHTAGFSSNASGGVRLQHNAGGGSGDFENGTCTVPTFLPALPTDGNGSVRVTVCVPLDELSPDLLSSFGFSISGHTVEMTTTYPYEL